MELRKTTQFMLPVSTKPTNKGEYDIYPAFPLKSGKIRSGYEKLADLFHDQNVVLLDGYIGTFWDLIKQKLSTCLDKKRISVEWISMEKFFKDENDVDKMIESNLGGNDPLFGYRYEGKLIDFFDQKKLMKLKAGQSDLTIIYGCGAFLTGLNGIKVYIDLPKNELQFRARAGSITNLGAEKPFHPKKMYKRFYFIDWIVLNRHKEEYLHQMDWIVDGQRAEMPLMISRTDLSNGIREMSCNFFRVRPWFEPGVWGGQYLKKLCSGLAQNVPNYAWSFELIVPENGLIFVSDDKFLEVSFEFLMYHDPKAILGRGTERFGTEFPIRIDYLDTIEGGNLSIQCHPRTEYLKKEFGENFTQDETYYIMECKPESSVYLGFQAGIQKEIFQETLERSQREQIEVEIDQFVQKIPSKKHDLFLIPSGTIHGSGKGNLVLEISSTPYIFTFKMYDWMRLDLDGKPRPINIQRGMENLYFMRQGEFVQHELIAQPRILIEEEDWKLIHLPTHQDHFYDIHRIDFLNTVEIEIEEESCHVMVVVEGSSIILETVRGMSQRFNYGETFVIPHAAQKYKLINESNIEAKVLKVFLK